MSESISVQQWSAPTDDADEVNRRAGGRRAYNARRRLGAAWRRSRLFALLGERSPWEHGAQSALAAALGVHRSTICRDFAAIAAEARLREGVARILGGSTAYARATPRRRKAMERRVRGALAATRPRTRRCRERK